MFFKRKAYDKLLEWKHNYSDRYAVLLEGARRVGKSTIAENFAKNEYKSYILIDFSKITNNLNTHKPQVCYKHVFNKFLLNSIRNKEQTKIKKTVSADYGYSKQIIFLNVLMI